MNKILITGGAGFIGYQLAKKLSKNEKNNITIVDNLSRGKMDKEFKELFQENNVSFREFDWYKKNLSFKKKALPKKQYTAIKQK